MRKFINYTLVYLILLIFVIIYWLLELKFYHAIIFFVIFTIIAILFTKSAIFPSKKSLRGWLRMKKKKGLKVLLVGDELLHAGLVKRELRKAGYDLRDLVHVISGERGLEILPSKQNGPFLSL